MQKKKTHVYIEFERDLMLNHGYFAADIRSLESRKYRDKFGRWYNEKNEDERSSHAEDLLED